MEESEGERKRGAIGVADAGGQRQTQFGKGEGVGIMTGRDPLKRKAVNTRCSSISRRHKETKQGV